MPWDDKHIRGTLREIFIYLTLFIATGKMVKYVFDTFIDPQATDIAQSKFEDKMRLNSKSVAGGIYKNEDEIASEF